MARKGVNQHSNFPYHITARTVNRDHFHVSISKMWSIMCTQLGLAHFKYDLKIHSFLLMPNHFHLIARTEQNSIGKIMGVILSETSKEINQITKRSNQTWGNRHFKSELIQYNYQLNTYKYVYQNPLRAKLCSRIEEWPFSTLNNILDFSKIEFPIEPDHILFNPEFNMNTLSWLNRMPTNDDTEMIRLALTRKAFRLPRNKNGTIHHLEYSSI
jgi:putative transposase